MGHSNSKQNNNKKKPFNDDIIVMGGLLIGAIALGLALYSSSDGEHQTPENRPLKHRTISGGNLDISTLIKTDGYCYMKLLSGYRGTPLSFRMAFPDGVKRYPHVREVKQLIYRLGGEILEFNYENKNYWDIQYQGNERHTYEIRECSIDQLHVEDRCSLDWDSINVRDVKSFECDGDRKMGSIETHLLHNYDSNNDETSFIDNRFVRFCCGCSDYCFKSLIYIVPHLFIWIKFISFFVGCSGLFLMGIINTEDDSKKNSYLNTLFTSFLALSYLPIDILMNPLLNDMNERMLLNGYCGLKLLCSLRHDKQIKLLPHLYAYTIYNYKYACINKFKLLFEHENVLLECYKSNDDMRYIKIIDGPNITFWRAKGTNRHNTYHIEKTCKGPELLIPTSSDWMVGGFEESYDGISYLISKYGPKITLKEDIVAMCSLFKNKLLKRTELEDIAFFCLNYNIKTDYIYKTNLKKMKSKKSYKDMLNEFMSHGDKNLCDVPSLIESNSKKIISELNEDFVELSQMKLETTEKIFSELVTKKVIVDVDFDEYKDSYSWVLRYYLWHQGTLYKTPLQTILDTSVMDDFENYLTVIGVMPIGFDKEKRFCNKERKNYSLSKIDYKKLPKTYKDKKTITESFNMWVEKKFLEGGNKVCSDVREYVEYKKQCNKYDAFDLHVKQMEIKVKLKNIILKEAGLDCGLAILIRRATGFHYCHLLDSYIDILLSTPWGSSDLYLTKKRRSKVTAFVKEFIVH